MSRALRFKVLGSHSLLGQSSNLSWNWNQKSLYFWFQFPERLTPTFILSLFYASAKFPSYLLAFRILFGGLVRQWTDFFQRRVTWRIHVFVACTRSLAMNDFNAKPFHTTTTTLMSGSSALTYAPSPQIILFRISFYWKNFWETL